MNLHEDMTHLKWTFMTVNTICIFGTRPEAIKMFPVIRQLEASACFSNKVCLTGQHQQMLEPLLHLLNITADFNLHAMVKNQDLSHLTANVLTQLVDVFNLYRPDVVLVHGDTTTTLAASISAYYHHIPVVHVEAGLRTGNMNLPWPEEANRKLVGSLASVHFAPTLLARLNLLREGVASDTIHVTGNTVIDALQEISTKIDTHPELRFKLEQKFSFLNPSRRLILVTGHRRENFGLKFEQICSALRLIAQKNPDVDIVYPVHLNPNIQHPAHVLLKNISNIYLIDPVEYVAFIYLMKLTYLILTDSGGIQEEAPSFGVPVLVMRDNTERPEAIEAGTAKLVGTDAEHIVNEVMELLTNEAAYDCMHQAKNPYGDGQAARRILTVLERTFVPTFERVPALHP